LIGTEAMATTDIPGSDIRALVSIRQLGRRRKAAEYCELCSAELPPDHPHLIEPVERRIVCSCAACSLLFEGTTTARYRRIPRDPIWLRDFVLDDVQWEEFSIPIGLAFFFYSSAAQRMIALYPSPGGAMESLLPLDAWKEVARLNPRLERMQPDVEALLVNRLGKPHEHYLAPIDRCYELTGLVRKHWRGFSGGDEVWGEVKSFFDRLRGVPQGELHAQPAL
jgi:hypothetical protein